MLKELNKVSILKKLVLSSVVVFGLGLSAFATQNKLSAVEVNNSVNGYQIILRADKPTVVRKNIQSTDEILITVKGIVPVESVATIYNNVPDVDSVMIEPDSKDNIKILVHGKDVYKTNVAFGSIEAVIPQPETVITDETAGTLDGASTEDASIQTSENDKPNAEVELAAPIQAYAPIYEQGSEYEPDGQPSYEDMAKSAARMTVSAIKNASPIAKRVYNKLAKVDKKLLGLGGLFLIIILAGVKALGGSKDNDLKIGLSQSLKENTPSAAQKQVQMQGANAMRAQNPSMTKVPPNMNYGLKAYGQSQKDPYTQQSFGYAPQKQVAQSQTVSKPSLQRRPVSQEEIARNLALLKQQQRFAQAAVSQPKMAPNPKIKMAQATEPGIQANSVDSIKFLESMAKIYERSGREDLAKGLKSNIHRMKASNLQETAS